jgi:hypothetical protein
MMKKIQKPSRVLFVGDVMLGRQVNDALKEQPLSCPSPIYRPSQQLFPTCDTVDIPDTPDTVDIPNTVDPLDTVDIPNTPDTLRCMK